MKERRVSSSAGKRKLAVATEPHQLFGREHELARIYDLLEHDAALGGSLLIRGEPGIGKSALLDEAKRRAEKLGVLVLTTAGAPFEAQMPFAALHRLLLPLASGIDALPKRQREALLVAFGVGDGPAPDVYLIALAALQVLADRAGEAPLLLVVEDAHWLDASTCEVLAFVARRLEMEPIIALFAARDDAPAMSTRQVCRSSSSGHWTTGARTPSLPRALRSSGRKSGGGCSTRRTVIRWHLSSSRGPWIPVSLLSCRATAPLPLTERLERAFAVQVSGLPSATRLMLLVAALDEAADLREILAAASLIGNRQASVDDVAPAAAAGLVSVYPAGTRLVRLDVGLHQLRVPRMTAGTTPGDTAAKLLARTRYILLDFDGPVCDIFAGLPDATVAARLRKLISGHGVQIPDEIARTPDPIEVFTYSANISTALATMTEAEMAEQELAAVATARPAPYVHDVVTSCRDSGRPVAVVSNNAERAVRSYLALHGLDDRIDLIAARTSPDPALLKPSPHFISQAITGLRAQPGECVLIGDSTTDIQAANRAGIASIGYANRPGKPASLTAAGATAVVTSLADLVLPIRARAWPLPN